MTDITPLYRPRVTLQVQLRHVTDAAGRTLYYRFVAHERAGFIRTADAPLYVRGGDWFEVERMEGGPWPRWKAVRPVFAPRR